MTLKQELQYFLDYGVCKGNNLNPFVNTNNNAIYIEVFNPTHRNIAYITKREVHILKDSPLRKILEKFANKHIRKIIIEDNIPWVEDNAIEYYAPNWEAMLEPDNNHREEVQEPPISMEDPLQGQDVEIPASDDFIVRSSPQVFVMNEMQADLYRRFYG